MTTITAAQPRALEHRLEVDGLRLQVRETGPPDAPPVLLLHGMMGTPREWDVLTDALSGRHRVLALHQRGHGESDHAADYSAAAFVSDVRAVLGALDLDRVHLIGHSLGGMVGMLLAAEQPDAVDHLVLVDIGPPSLSTEWGLRELPVMLQALATARYGDPEEALHAWAAGDPLARAALLRHYVTHSLVPDGRGRWRWRFDAARLAGFCTSVTEAQLWDALDRIVAPTLVVRGEHSHLLTAGTADRMDRRLRDGRLVVIPSGGHDLGVQQPEAVAAAVGAFLPAPDENLPPVGLS